MVIKDVVHGIDRAPVIALDFDGVLHSYSSGWTGPIPQDPPVAGAIEFCEWLLSMGYKVIIFSTRAHPKLGKGDRPFIDHARPNEDGTWTNTGEKGVTLGEYAMRAWFRYYRFPEEIVNARITHKKEHADMYVDDRGWRFDGVWAKLKVYLETNPTCTPWTGSQ